MFEKCAECGTEFTVGIKACPNCSAPLVTSVNDQPLVWRDSDGVPHETTTGLPPEQETGEQSTDRQDAEGLEHGESEPRLLVDAPPIPTDTETASAPSRKK
jgi:hypothetical protein